MQRSRAFPATVIILAFAVLLSAWCDASAVEHREPPAKHTLGARQAKSPLTSAIDSKAKLIGFNRALADRLQHTRTALQPLESRATALQRRFVSARTHARSPSVDPAKTRAERDGLLRDALHLRAAVERKLVGFGALDRNVRTLRTLARAPGPSGGGLPRGWLDRDTERQMELNERIYKNIIDLLVHLIECPVNIIHDMMGGSTTPAPTEQPDYAADDADPDGNALYDVDVAEGGDTDAEGQPWLEEFHY